MKTVGVFFGSRSPEHDVSIVTAQLIIDGLKKLNYPVVPVYINKSGNWLIGEELGNLKNFTDEGIKIGDEKKYQQYFLDLEQSRGKIVFRKKGIGGKTVIIDIAFPAFHGSFGEDGTMQGLFEMFQIPYIGCGVAASAVSMDKAFVKQLCCSENIPTTKFVFVNKTDWKNIKPEVLEKISKLNFPLFVKPVHLGSSIAISKVGDKKDLDEKIEVAFYYDEKIIVEESVNNLMDVTCCVIGNKELIASELQESAFSAELFDFEEKYLKDGGTQLGKSENGLIIPARLDDKISNEIKNTAKTVYKLVGCSGIARVDFLFDKEAEKFFVNEINPLPGTLYHHLWKASGIEFSDLLDKLIIYAEDRHKNEQDLSFTFKSSLLTNLNSQKLNSKKLKGD